MIARFNWETWNFGMLGLRVAVFWPECSGSVKRAGEFRRIEIKGQRPRKGRKERKERSGKGSACERSQVVRLILSPSPVYFNHRNKDTEAHEPPRVTVLEQ
jgi:hypothetical protein